MLSKKAVAEAAAQSAQTRDLMQACKDGSLANAKKAIAEGADVAYAVRQFFALVTPPASFLALVLFVS
jgi:hypothetical protein